jgi:hypothetical protein
MSQHYLQSTYREKLIEHLFIGELLKHSWHHRNCALEIAKPEVDNCGYDAIASEGTVIRHLQLKTTSRGAKAAFQKVQIALGTKPSGCVIWINFDAHSLELGPYLIFGALAGERLPSLEAFKFATHTKPNSEGIKTKRVNLKKVPKSHFKVFKTVAEVYSVLFDPDPERA